MPISSRPRRTVRRLRRNIYLPWHTSHNYNIVKLIIEHDQLDHVIDNLEHD